MTGYGLQITEANHDENEFFTLGGAIFDTAEERQASIDALPRFVHDCADESVRRCYTVDVLNEDGWSIVDNIEVSETTAQELLGTSDFEPMRQSERAALRAVAAGVFDR
ncbi:hypothetical protein EDD28_2436 [Salana multivorans]|uniref:Uncharacterized protein n=1 Tax=Salana multivorans TaxID=120377 RepID=A0A3N2DDN2_9MICO|nr:hypothetical protein [Salana multivorans]ROR97827.1 hypothetical protein EDD28_2436 [Salana multivorans]